jgi:hypothetical protein
VEIEAVVDSGHETVRSAPLQPALDVRAPGEPERVSSVEGRQEENA